MTYIHRTSLSSIDFGITLSNSLGAWGLNLVVVGFYNIKEIDENMYYLILQEM